MSSQVRFLAAGLVLLATTLGCGAPDPPDVDGAGEAVVRHLAERSFGPYRTAPWDVVCLARRDGFGGEADEVFLARFEDHEPPVVSGAVCVESTDDDGARWLVEGTGEVGLEIHLRGSAPAGDARLLIDALASGGPWDFSVYECVVVLRDDRWEVEECVATIMT